jgi:hypothetical protein
MGATKGRSSVTSSLARMDCGAGTTEMTRRPAASVWNGVGHKLMGGLFHAAD